MLIFFESYPFMVYDSKKEGTKDPEKSFLFGALSVQWFEFEVIQKELTLLCHQMHTVPKDCIKTQR